MKVRLGACKTGLSPPSNFILLIVPGDTSVVVPFVVCFGVEFLYFLNLMYVFIFLFKFEWPPIGKYLLTRPITICFLSISI